MTNKDVESLEHVWKTALRWVLWSGGQIRGGRVTTTTTTPQRPQRLPFQRQQEPRCGSHSDCFNTDHTYDSEDYLDSNTCCNDQCQQRPQQQRPRYDYNFEGDRNIHDGNDGSCGDAQGKGTEDDQEERAERSGWEDLTTYLHFR